MEHSNFCRRPSFPWKAVTWRMSFESRYQYALWGTLSKAGDCKFYWVSFWLVMHYSLKIFANLSSEIICGERWEKGEQCNTAIWALFLHMVWLCGGHHSPACQSSANGKKFWWNRYSFYEQTMPKGKFSTENWLQTNSTGVLSISDISEGFGSLL